MKKIFLLSSVLFSSVTFAEPASMTSKKMPTTIEGCTQSVTNEGHSPTGSGQLCFFNNGAFVGIGFGFMKFGGYRIVDGIIQMLFNRPLMYEVMTAFDPKQKGVSVQFEGFNDGNDTAYNAMISFDKQAFHPVLQSKDSCVGVAEDKQIAKFNDLHIFDILHNEPTVWHFHLPSGYNRVVIQRQNANDELYRLRQSAIVLKDNQIYLLDDEGKFDSVIEPLGHSDNEENDKFMQKLKQVSRTIAEKRTFVMRNEFREFEDKSNYYTFNQANNTYSLKPSYYQEMEASESDNFDGRYDTIRRYQVLTPQQNPVVLADLTVDKTALFFAKCN